MPDPFYEYVDDHEPENEDDRLNRCVNWFLTGLGFLAALALVSGVVWMAVWP
jgi:hypothetical protein